jgi:hypothetical protein
MRCVTKCLTPVPDTRAYPQTTQLAASNTLHIVSLQLRYFRALLIAKILYMKIRSNGGRIPTGENRKNYGEKPACRNDTTQQNIIQTALEWKMGLGIGRPVSNRPSQGTVRRRAPTERMTSSFASSNAASSGYH